MRKTKQPEDLNKRRLAIAEKVSRLRRDRRWTQAALSRHLGLSQTRLSQIESGNGSLTAEQFLAVLELFNVSAAELGAASTANRGDDLQNALARLGARHLNESSNRLPSDRLASATDVARETLLVSDSPRQLTALGPVLVANADGIQLRMLEARLAELGCQRRLGWLLESVVTALEHELTKDLTRTWRQAYKRASLVLGSHVESMVTRGGAKWSETNDAWDVIDRSVRSNHSLREITAAASPIARRWGIATSLRTEDFERALAASRVG